MSTVWQVTVFRKNFAFTKSSIEKSGTSTFWVDLNFEWYGDAMVFYIFIFILFYFCLEATLLGRDTWMRATSATVWYFFSKLLDHSYIKVSSQQLGGTSTTEFWRTPYGWRFMDIDKDTCEFFHQRFSKYHETKRRRYENYHFFFL